MNHPTLVRTLKGAVLWIRAPRLAPASLGALDPRTTPFLILTLHINCKGQNLERSCSILPCSCFPEPSLHTSLNNKNGLVASFLTGQQMSNVHTSVSWVFNFCNTHQFWVFEKFQNQRTTKFKHLKKIRNRESLGLGIWKKTQILRTVISVYFKNFKEPLGFMKEPKK